MANTYSRIYIQVVFAVQHRDSLIMPDWEEELFKYITGVVQNKDQKMLSINGTSNHIHFLLGMKPNCCLSDLVREVKKSSVQMIRKNGLSRFRFQWQEGFGSFSYGHSQLDYIIPYIARQKEHHRRISFKEEYISLLKEFDVEFNDDYLFNWIGD